MTANVPATKNPDYYPRSGTAVAVRYWADRLNWLAVVDTLMPWDPCRARIAPSAVLLMLVINVLTYRQPLYKLEEWAASLPLGLLWGEALDASQFNDDAFGRVLEDLADYGPQVLATVGARMQALRATETEWLHSDTTAYALFGDYPSDSSGPTAPIELTWGHSKDHRPDLKQVMAGVTMDAEGCVLAGSMLSGNTSDRKWNADWVKQLTQDFPDDFWRGRCYIADSAMMSQSTIEQIRATGMDWLGRLPNTFTLCGDLKSQAWSQPMTAWEELGSLAQKPTAQSATYQSQTLDVTFLDRPARAFVYHSRGLDKKKEHTLQKEIAREHARLTKAAKHLARQTFHCAEDAEAAAQRSLQSVHGHWYTVVPTATAHEVPVKRRGRPKAGEPRESHTVYTVAWDATAPGPEQIQAERERRSTFILLTSKLALDARTALQEYKAQDHNEHGFRWTKSPIHLGAFWLEKPERVAGLGYALLLALQFARFLRALVRTELHDEPPLELPHGRRVQQPSDAVILDALSDLDMQKYVDAQASWYQWSAVLPYQRRILEALDVPIDRRFVWDPSG